VEVAGHRAGELKAKGALIGSAYPRRLDVERVARPAGKTKSFRPTHLWRRDTRIAGLAAFAQRLAGQKVGERGSQQRFSLFLPPLKPTLFFNPV
jgi:hypothetical protein